MLGSIKKAIENDNEIDSGILRVLSLVFLLLSGAMSFFQYTNIDGFWYFDIKTTFKPGFISTILALFLISPLYMRGILKWNKSLYSLLSLILILLVFASFSELALGGNDKSTVVIFLLSSALIVSWLGIREVAGASWMLALIAAIYSAVENNLAMGFYGFVYVSSGFIGLVLHSGLNPGHLLNGIKNEYSSLAEAINLNTIQNTNDTVKKNT